MNFKKLINKIGKKEEKQEIYHIPKFDKYVYSEYTSVHNIFIFYSTLGLFDVKKEDINDTDVKVTLTFDKKSCDFNYVKSYKSFKKYNKCLIASFMISAIYNKNMFIIDNGHIVTGKFVNDNKIGKLFKIEINKDNNDKHPSKNKFITTFICGKKLLDFFIKNKVNQSNVIYKSHIYNIDIVDDKISNGRIYYNNFYINYIKDLNYSYNIKGDITFSNTQDINDLFNIYKKEIAQTLNDYINYKNKDKELLSKLSFNKKDIYSNADIPDYITDNIEYVKVNDIPIFVNNITKEVVSDELLGLIDSQVIINKYNIASNKELNKKYKEVKRRSLFRLLTDFKRNHSVKSYASNLDMRVILKRIQELDK